MSGHGGARLSTQPFVLVCNRIKAARMERGWGMRELAREAGVSPSTVCRIEMDREPSLENALKIAQALGYPVEELWYLPSPPERKGTK